MNHNISSDENQVDQAPQEMIVRPIFMGLTLQLSDSKDRQVVLKAAQELFKESPTLKKVGISLDFESNDEDQCNLYDVDSDLIEITIGLLLSMANAWDLTYEFRQLDKVIYVEPRFALLDPNDNFSPGLDAQRIRKSPSCVPKDCEWHLDDEHMQIKKAWKEFFEEKGKQPGEKVVIAHPDTGFLPHDELDQSLRLKLEQNDREKTTKSAKANIDQYVDGSGKLSDPQQALNRVSENEILPVSYWHGTATASLIVSPAGKQIHDQISKHFVTGVAPAATLKPYRLGPTQTIATSGFEFFSPSLAKAINDAARRAEQEKIRVISISLGGYPSLSIHRAIINAQRQGIIVVAAAGNMTPFVVWPGAYDKVIAVASSTFDNTIANFSSIGSRVDIAVPSEFVYVAIATKKNGKLSYTVKARSGTSYAAPLLAGIAALWISHHTWEKLIETYKIPARIPLVFDKLLRATCDKPEGWDFDTCGAGIVNAYNLLKADLPNLNDPYIQEPLAYREVDHVRLDRGGIETFVHLFEQTLSNPKFLEGISIKTVAEFKLANLIKSDYFGSSSLAKEIRLDIAQWALKNFLALEVSGKDFRQFLRTFGREITFHLGTNLALYQRVDNVLKRFAGLPVDSEDAHDDLQSVLTALAEISSCYLRRNLPSHGITNR